LLKRVFGQGNIPADWNIQNISDIGEVVTGSTPSTIKKEYYGGDYLFVKPSDLHKDKIISNTETKLTLQGFNQCRKIPSNSIMVTCIGSIGEMGISGKELSTNQQINTIICKDKVIPDYVFYNIIFRKRFLEIYANQSLLPIINKSDFSKIPLPVPPLVEQRGIVEVLGTVDEAIRRTDAVIEKVEELKRGLMQRLLTWGMGHTEFKQTEQGEIPKTWEISLLNDVGEIITGTTPSTKIPEYYGKDYQFISPFDMGSSKYIYKTQKMISKKGLEVSRALPKHSVLVVCIGSTIGKVGMTSEVGSTNQQINSIICNEKWDPNFVYYYLLHKEKLFKMYAGKSPVPILNKTEFSKIIIKYPKIEEQREISKMLSSIDKKKEEEKIYLKKLKDIKEGLMQSLLSGKVRVELKADGLHRIGNG